MDDVAGTCARHWPARFAGHPALRDRLLAAYGGPDRGYHDQRHLAEVLERLDLLLHESRPEDTRGVGRDALVLAAWFHDAVYGTGSDGQPGGPDADVERSAVLAETELGAAAAPDALVTEVARLVRLTATHRPEPHDNAGRLLCDADLAILAAAPGRYREYVAGVRAEHADVPDDAFRRGRAAVLEDLTAGPWVFSTARGRELWEDAARRNVREELASLRAGDPLPER